jgi:hypothetical protein
MGERFPLTTRAFGMDVEAAFAMPGVEPSALAGDGHSLSLRLGSAAEVEDGFTGSGDRLAELRFDDGRLAISIDAVDGLGYLSYAVEFGRARIAPDGRTAVIAPLDGPDWVWQRYLTGQVLPFAALLQGHEVFHACVMGVEGRAIAAVAQSGGGKTTTALRLALRDLDFMSDDVLVLEPDGDGVRAHPGIGLANLRPGAERLQSELEAAGLATPIGSNDRETRLAVRRSDESLPFTALFILNRQLGPRPLEVERLDPVDPRLLLAATFNLAVQTPERLTRQLDVCARIDRSASAFRVSFGSDVSPDEVADAIVERAGVP